MKVIIISIYLLTAGLSNVEAGADADHHSHKGHETSGLSLNQGSKWKTDAPLRQGMLKINDEFKKFSASFHNDTLTKKDASKLAKNINEQVEYLITNCKLKPEADATLHVLIGDLLQGADALSKKPLSMNGMPKIHKALMLYTEYFDQPGK